MSFTTCHYYADSVGNIYGASLTDQAGSRSKEGRTVNGRPVLSIGLWSTSQKDFRPFSAAVSSAVALLRTVST